MKFNSFCLDELLLGQDHRPDTEGSLPGGSVLEALPAVETQMEREGDTILEGQRLAGGQLCDGNLIPPMPDR